MQFLFGNPQDDELRAAAAPSDLSYALEVMTLAVGETAAAQMHTGGIPASCLNEIGRCRRVPGAKIKSHLGLIFRNSQRT